jgi:hypothetical protein
MTLNCNYFETNETLTTIKINFGCKSLGRRLSRRMLLVMLLRLKRREEFYLKPKSHSWFFWCTVWEFGFLGLLDYPSWWAKTLDSISTREMKSESSSAFYLNEETFDFHWSRGRICDIFMQEICHKQAFSTKRQFKYMRVSNTYDFQTDGGVAPFLVLFNWTVHHKCWCIRCCTML